MKSENRPIRGIRTWKLFSKHFRSTWLIKTTSISRSIFAPYWNSAEQTNGQIIPAGRTQITHNVQLVGASRNIILAALDNTAAHRWRKQQFCCWWDDICRRIPPLTGAHIHVGRDRITPLPSPRVAGRSCNRAQVDNVRDVLYYVCVHGGGIDSGQCCAFNFTATAGGKKKWRVRWMNNAFEAWESKKGN